MQINVFKSCLILFSSQILKNIIWYYCITIVLIEKNNSTISVDIGAISISSLKHSSRSIRK